MACCFEIVFYEKSSDHVLPFYTVVNFQMNICESADLHCVLLVTSKIKRSLMVFN